MQRTFVGVILILSSVWPADKVQPLSVKVGLWEVSQTVRSNGQIPIPAALLDKLSPEQRARVEERMKARSAEPPRTTKRKYCLTQEERDHGVTFDEEHKSCTRTIITSTSSKLEMRLECSTSSKDARVRETVRIEALSPERVSATVQTKLSDDRPPEDSRSLDSSSTFTAKWLGPVCGSVR